MYSLILICIFAVSFSNGLKAATEKDYGKTPDGNFSMNAHCMCENGECLEDSSGKLKCVCLPEYGLYDSYRCKACLCGPGANCTFVKGWFKTYVKCICPKGSRKGADKRCEDPCKSNPCKNGGKCKVDFSGVKCDCSYPYYGQFCEQDPCMENPCKNGGSCIVAEDEIECSCRSPFRGEFCEIGPCTKNPCKNNGICVVEDKRAVCRCKSPYRGSFCEESPCSPNPCKNDGLCRENEDGYGCYCIMPFYGELCEKEVTTPTYSTENDTSPVFRTITTDGYSLILNETSEALFNFTDGSNKTSTDHFNFTNSYNFTDEPFTANLTTDYLYNITSDFNETTSDHFNFTSSYNFTDEPFTANLTTSDRFNFTGELNETVFN